ncbi:hypothetical protein [Ruixingdingia sedimenti]|uniref:Uncharacterized protein n=1 Tax=Ruixingdingia sedimenti TaxID=3073604 RepID=A0ABU1FFZ7_9RHOB|nr:hypothetical protein [Xinfangfangia sp. LG-4]MDR5655483.1 hypothetical protein [Xinfangfangia sp. LG-4]
MFRMLVALGVAGGLLFAPYLSLAVLVAAVIPRGWIFALFALLVQGR